MREERIKKLEFEHDSSKSHFWHWIRIIFVSLFFGIPFLVNAYEFWVKLFTK